MTPKWFLRSCLIFSYLFNSFIFFFAPVLGSDALETKILEAWVQMKADVFKELSQQAMDRALESQESEAAFRALNLVKLEELTEASEWDAWRQRAGFDPKLQLALDWESARTGDTDPLKNWGFCRNFEILGPFDDRDQRNFRTFEFSKRNSQATLEGPSNWRSAQVDVWGVLNLQGHFDVTDHVLAGVRTAIQLDKSGPVTFVIDSDADWRFFFNGEEVTESTVPQEFSINQTSLTLDCPAGLHQLQWVVAERERGWQFRVRAEAEGNWFWSSETDYLENVQTIPEPMKKVTAPQQASSFWEFLDHRRRGFTSEWMADPSQSPAKQLIAHLEPKGLVRSQFEIENNSRRQALLSIKKKFPHVLRSAHLLTRLERENLLSPFALTGYLDDFENHLESWILKGELSRFTSHQFSHWLKSWKWQEELSEDLFWRQWALLEQAGDLEKLRECFERALNRWPSEQLYLKALPMVSGEHLGLFQKALKRHPGWKDLRWALVGRLKWRDQPINSLIQEGLQLSPMDARGNFFLLEEFIEKEKREEAEAILETLLAKRPGVLSWERLKESFEESEFDSFPRNDFSDNPKKYVKSPLVRLQEEIFVEDLGGGLMRWQEMRQHLVNDPKALGDHRIYLISEAAEDHVEVLQADIFRESSRSQAVVSQFDYSPGGDDPIRITSIEWPDLKKGDLLFLKFRKIRHRPTYFGDYFAVQHPFRSPFPLVSGSLTVKSLRPLKAGGRGVSFEQPEDNLWVWNVRDVAPLEKEKNTPESRSLGPTVEVSSFQSWEDFGRWYSSLIKSQKEITPAIQNKVQELTRDCRLIEEKIEKLYSFVTNDIRYVTWEFGIHGYKPYTANQIFKNDFGDCKDKSLLLHVMLKEIGVPSKLVILRAEENRGPEDFSVPLVAHFNHCILAIEWEGAPLYVDCTAEGYELSLPAMNTQTQGLAVADSSGALVELPASNPLRDSFFVHDTLKWVDRNVIRWSAKFKCLGKYAQPWRLWLEHERNRNNYLSHKLTQALGASYITHSELLNLERLSEPIVCKAEAILNQAFDPFKSSLKLPDDMIQDLSRWIETHRVSSLRQNPLLIGTLWNWQCVTQLEFPEGWKPQGQTISFSSDFGELEWKIEPKETGYELRRLIKVKKRSVKPEEFPQFQKFLREMKQVVAQEVMWIR